MRIVHLLVLSLILIITSTLSACNKTEEKTGPVEIHFYIPFQNNNTPPFDAWIKTYQEAAANFHTLNPMITVILDYNTKGSFSVDEIFTLLESEESPDIVPVPPVFVAKAEKRELLWDLQPLHKESGTKEIDINEQILKSAMINGKLLALPYSVYPQAVLFNKQLFDDAKIPYPQGDWTWEQFREIASKVNALGDPLFYYSPFNLDFLMANSGKGIISPEGDTTIGYLDSPEAVKSLQWINDYYHESGITEPKVGGINPYGQFEGQLTGLIIGGFGMQLPSFMGENKKNLGIAPLPHFEGSNRSSPVEFDGFGISQKSKHPEAAWKFIEYLTLSNNQDAINYASRFLTTSKTVAEANGQNTDPEKSIFLDEINYAFKSSVNINPLLLQAWNAELDEEFQKLIMVKDRDLGDELHRIAIKLDQELHRLQKIEDEQTESPAP